MADYPYSHPYYSTIPTISSSPSSFYSLSTPPSPLPNPYPYDYSCYSYCNFYQQPNNTYTSLNHHHDGFPNSQSPFTSSLTPPSLTHINLSHINFAIQELERSQKACLQAISNLSSDISTLNKYHTPPSTYNNIHPAQQNTSVLHNSFNHQQPFTPPPLTIFTQPYKSQVTSQITLPPYNSIHVPAENHDAKKLVPNLTIHSDPESPVVVEKHVFIAENFNEEAPSNLVLDFTTTFSSPKTENLLREDNITVKDQGEDNHRLSPSIPPSPCDSDRVEYSTSRSSISVPMSLAPAKHCLITTVRPSPEKTVASTAVMVAPLPHHFFIFDSGGDDRRVCSLAAIVGNDFCAFDPGGEKHNFGSLTLISINNYGTQSPLQVPWDRGKLGASKSIFSVKLFFINCLFSFTPAAILFPARGAAAGWPWVPWSSKTLMIANITGAVMHVKKRTQ
jgi:hypothetical protein